jgi:hypothetical protein
LVESRPPNRESNSKANRLKHAILKIHSLKEIEAASIELMDSVEKRGQRVEKLAHHRRVLSFLIQYVQHIERMFSFLFSSC